MGFTGISFIVLCLPWTLARASGCPSQESLANAAPHNMRGQRNTPCVCCLSRNRIRASGWLGVLSGLDMRRGGRYGDQIEAVGLSAVQSGISHHIMEILSFGLRYELSIRCHSVKKVVSIFYA